MSNALANLEGLKVLTDRGYALSIINAHLVVNDVFHLDATGMLQKGALAAPLNLVDGNTLGPPVNHQMHWSGADPHFVDATPIPQLGTGTSNLKLGERTYLRHLSNKPPEGFPTYTLLVEHYVALLSAPAAMKFGVSALTGAVADEAEEAAAFSVSDTFSARAEILDLNALIASDHIAIIGLGGTGGYLLDFMVKAPVASIRAFDSDVFKVHNGFRAPGEVPTEFFGHPKVDIYRNKYADFRRNLTLERTRISVNDDEKLIGVTFAFVCIDDGEARREICDMLVRLCIPFIDTGMGIEKEAGKLDGLIRTTLVTPENSAKAMNGIPCDSGNPAADAYRVFVQIAELNALNAAAAVIRYKQFRGFYTDDENWIETVFGLGPSKVWGKK